MLSYTNLQAIFHYLSPCFHSASARLQPKLLSTNSIIQFHCKWPNHLSWLVCFCIYISLQVLTFCFAVHLCNVCHMSTCFFNTWHSTPQLNDCSWCHFIKFHFGLFDTQWLFSHLHPSHWCILSRFDLSSIISPNQSTFIGSKQSVDSVLVASKCIDEMIKRKELRDSF